ncbi:DUF5941 domain-containing protein [Kineosporia sp. R_H_3]|uniref:DUF5941 domain-containing protein n=1 Tax=Kineosporia sp. R_H_3 TaxID=1961848 RepID=UPI000B4B8E67|nr:DUF5941 domain-containing protein [Kineosporia sp. R_H_3]
MSGITYDVYRDDGPLARGLGRAGSALPDVHVLVPVILGVLPLAAVVAFAGPDLPARALGATLGWYVLCGGIASRLTTGTLSWLAPPIMRAAEYLVILRIAMWASDDAALPAAFALLSALTFHHYDSVYRLRHQRVAPPTWLTMIAGGWELRLVAAYAVAVAGVVAQAYYVAAGAFALLFVTESVASWARFIASQRRASLVQSEDEEEDE